MSMKLHVVAASDIQEKGLDPSFPYSQLGEDGLLLVSSQTEKAVPALTIPSQTEQVSVPVDVPEEVKEPQEPVEVPEQKEEQEEPVKGLEIPLVEEDKKPGKRSKKPA